MINCKLNLYIIVLNKQDLRYEVISESTSHLIVPYTHIKTNDKIDNLLCDIFKTHVDLDPGYTNFILSDIYNTDELNINYFCLVPYTTKIIHGHLLPINYNEISSSSVRHILSKL